MARIVNGSIRLAFVEAAGVAHRADDIEEALDGLTAVESLKTERGPRTIALDPNTHRIYLLTAQLRPPPSPAQAASPGRPMAVPKTPKLLVYGHENESARIQNHKKVSEGVRLSRNQLFRSAFLRHLRRISQNGNGAPGLHLSSDSIEDLFAGGDA